MTRTGKKELKKCKGKKNWEITKGKRQGANYEKQYLHALFYAHYVGIWIVILLFVGYTKHEYVALFDRDG